MLRGWTAEDAMFVSSNGSTERKPAARCHHRRLEGLREEVLRGRSAGCVLGAKRHRWPACRVGAADLCREIGGSQRPIVGAVGRLSGGHRTLLDAFQLLRRSIPGAQLVLVGDVPEEPALRRQAHDLGLSASTTFTGLRRDGQQIVGALDVMALPSFSEGMPNVVLEAFAYGTPVVATAVGGVPDLVADARSGWLVPAGDPRAGGGLMEASKAVRGRAGETGEPS
jgi:glycosyltransferase involved in cell wall biosynthesis